VTIWGTLEGGESFLLRELREVPHFWILERDRLAASKLGANVVEDDRPRTTLRGEPVARVNVAAPADTPELRDRLIRAGYDTFEADVRFPYRYLIDRGIRGTLEIHGTSHPGRGIDAIFVNAEVVPASWSPKLSVLSLDIETDPKAQRLLSAALVSESSAEVLLLTPKGHSCPADATPFPDERALLRALVARVREIDPDVLVGWNLVDFDLTVLLRLSEQWQVPLALGRGRELLRIVRERWPRPSLRARVPGRVVLDGIQLLRGAFLRFESYSLDAVSREVLGEGKTILGPDRASAILEAFEHDREGIVQYNRKDARLVLEILSELGLVELSVERSRLTGMPPDRVAASIASFDFLYLSELGRRGIVAPTVTSNWPEAESLSGGHVLTPHPGLWRNVLVFDFRSLYPSIIRTFEIDPLGRLDASQPGEDPIVAPNGALFRRSGGILPKLLDELFVRREAAKRVGERAADQAIKILMNSFYGVLGTPACRFAAPELANAITSFGREILLWCRDRVEERGYRVLYGDTDSLFVHSGAENGEAARGIGERIVAEINAELKDHVRRTHRVESRLELEFETLYLKLLLPEMRHGTGGARKRYAGLVAEGGSMRVVFVGMEAVRSDWTELAKNVQRELYERLFSERPVGDFLREIVARVRSGGCDDQLVYRKALRKTLTSYTKSTPPHVAAARKLEGRVPRIVEYVITTAGPEPLENRSDPLDHEHYVQKQVRAVAEPVLAVLGLDFDRVVGDDRQMSLFSAE
jgi:DNA polymerase-2